MNKKKNKAVQGRHAVEPGENAKTQKAPEAGARPAQPSPAKSGASPLGAKAPASGAKQPASGAKQPASGAKAPAGGAKAPAKSKAPAAAGGATLAMPQAQRPGMPPGGGKAGPAGARQARPQGGGMLPVDMADAGKPHRKRKAGKIVGITFGVIFGVLAAVYIGVAIYFTGRFMPSSNIGDLDVSLMAAADAEQALSDSIQDYKLSISGEGFSLELSSSDAALSLDEGAVVGAMLEDMNPWLWPLELRKDHDETGKLVAESNGTGLEEAVRGAVATFNESAEQPVNATIAYDEAKSAFVVQPEKIGTALDPDAIIKAADEALAVLNPNVKLTDAHLLQPTVLSTDKALATAAANANTMIAANLVLTMAGDTAATVDADLISQWVVLGDDLTAALDDEALTAWVEQLASECNTVGTQRTYTRPDGKSITVSGGSYGWTVDNESLLATVRDAVTNGTTETVEVPTSTSGSAYNGVGQRDWGARYCDIDLSEQHVRFYDESGALVWESDCVSGLPNGKRDTPTGVYWLNQKASPSTLIGYENGQKTYETPVQYWMPFVGNSVGLHDANWQSSFGGSRYQTNGSHGCVNLPPSAAGELYGIIQSGDAVVCHW